MTTFDGVEWTFEKLTVFDAVHALCGYKRVDGANGSVGFDFYFGANHGMCDASGGVVLGGGGHSTERTITVLCVLSYPIPEIDAVLTQLVNNAVGAGVGLSCP